MKKKTIKKVIIPIAISACAVGAAILSVQYIAYLLIELIFKCASIGY